MTMYHPNKTIAALLLFGAVLSGCSQYEDIYDNNEEAKEEINGVVFRLRTNTTNDPLTRSAEDSYVHEQGSPDEYKVNNARVYLFEANTKTFVKKYEIKNLIRIGSDTSGNIIYETERVSVPQGTYDIFVTANTDREINKTTESEFLADIDSISYVKAHIEDISKCIIH